MPSKNLDILIWYCMRIILWLEKYQFYAVCTILDVLAGDARRVVGSKIGTLLGKRVLGHPAE